MAFLPQRVTLAGAAGALSSRKKADEPVYGEGGEMVGPSNDLVEAIMGPGISAFDPAPDPQSIRRAGTPPTAAQPAEPPDLSYGQATKYAVDLAKGVGSFLAGPYGGGRSSPGASSSWEIDKAAARAATGSHAAATASSARTDPAAGTGQGANQNYRGTGAVVSKTAKTGGVTTGEPGEGSAKGVRINVPGRGWETYDPTDPTVREAFAQARGGKPDSFMEHRTRTMPTTYPEAANAAVPRITRWPASPLGGSMWSESAVPEASQLENWNAYLEGREAQEQAFNTAMAQSRAGEAGAEAATARAGALAQEPFMAENIEAGGKLSAAQVKAASEISARDDLKKITSQAAEQINKLRLSPQYQGLPPAERQRLEDQIWDQARLTLSALTKTNLYPRPDPYAFLQGGGAPAAPAEEKPAS